VFPEEVFDKVFNHVLGMCVEKGMVSGHTQVVDSAPVKANASMDSLELKVPEEELEEHLRKVRQMSRADRKAKENKADQEQQTISASESELKEIESRNKKWRNDQDQRPGGSSKGAKYTSNKTHYSPTDPDARIRVKPGKARKLNYLSQLSVDIANHVITDIGADYADKKDSQCLQELTKRLRKRLNGQGLLMRNLVADAGYSSGDNYAFLEDEGLVSYIPAHGTYKGGPDGFTYNKEEDHWECTQGNIIPFVKVFFEGKNKLKKKEYRASKHVCKGCPIRTDCLKKSQEKRITITYYKDEYERAIARVKSKYGKYMKGKRQSTVEPVFGTLTQFMGMRKVNTRGIKQANKVMLMSAVAYNLKKYLKYTQKLANSKAGTAKAILSQIILLIRSKTNLFKPAYF